MAVSCLAIVCEPCKQAWYTIDYSHLYAFRSTQGFRAVVDKEIQAPVILSSAAASFPEDHVFVDPFFQPFQFLSFPNHTTCVGFARRHGGILLLIVLGESLKTSHGRLLSRQSMAGPLSTAYMWAHICPECHVLLQRGHCGRLLAFCAADLDATVGCCFTVAPVAGAGGSILSWSVMVLAALLHAATAFGAAPASDRSLVQHQHMRSVRICATASAQAPRQH